MATDVLMIQGGDNEPVTGGSYDRTNGIESRVFRSLKARRGFWIGGRGIEFGSDLRTLKKDTPENRNLVPRIVAIALDHLIQQNLLIDLVVDVTGPVGKAIIEIGYQDATDSQDKKLALETGWTL